MKFRVAKTLSRSVEELEEEITYNEYADWIAFLNMEDWKTTRLEFYLAQLCHITMRVNGNKKSKLKDFLLEDPYNPKKKEAQTTDLWHKLNTWVSRHNKAVVEREKEKKKPAPRQVKPTRKRRDGVRN